MTGTDGLPMQLTDGIASVLARLRERGVRLGIICDVGLTPSTTLRSYLADHDVLEYFDHWSFSDEVGAYKPSPTIFADALAGLGVVEPSRAAHVGDLLRTDVSGARAMGMLSVRYRGVNDDGGAVDAAGLLLPEADLVIDDHTQLLDLLPLT